MYHEIKPKKGLVYYKKGIIFYHYMQYKLNMKMIDFRARRTESHTPLPGYMKKWERANSPFTKES